MSVFIVVYCSSFVFKDDRKVGRVLFDACCVRFANVCMEVKNSGNVLGFVC